MLTYSQAHSGFVSTVYCYIAVNLFLYIHTSFTHQRLLKRQDIATCSLRSCLAVPSKTAEATSTEPFMCLLTTLYLSSSL